MIIGIDIDSTITSTGSLTRKCLKEYTSEYDDYYKLPKEKYEEFLKIYLKYIHINCELKDGVKEAFNYFNNKGYKIIIITARNNEGLPNEIEITKDYFKKHNLKYNKIIFNQTQKGKVAKANKIDIFIDDKEEVLDDINSYGIKCIRYTKDLNSKYQAFNNWKDIIEYLKKRGGIRWKMIELFHLMN